MAMYREKFQLYRYRPAFRFATLDANFRKMTRNAMEGTEKVHIS